MQNSRAEALAMLSNIAESSVVQPLLVVTTEIKPLIWFRILIRHTCLGWLSATPQSMVTGCLLEMLDSRYRSSISCAGRSSGTAFWEQWYPRQHFQFFQRDTCLECGNEYQ